MQDWHVSVAEAAKLLEIGERAVQKNALAGKYGELRYIKSSLGGRGGRMIRISLSALPAEYQAKYIEEHGLGSQEEAAQTVTPFDEAPAWARERAHRNHAILTAYESFLTQPGKKGELTETFVREWNESHPDETISKTTLYRWKKDFQTAGMAAFLPQHGQNKGKHSLSEALFNEFVWLLKKKIAHLYRADRCTLTSHNMRLNMDGEIVPMERARFTVQPASLLAHWPGSVTAQA